MCVCVYMYMCICTYSLTQSFTRLLVFFYICTYIYVSTQFPYMHVHLYHTNIWHIVYKYKYIHIYMYMYIRLCNVEFCSGPGLDMPGCSNPSTAIHLARHQPQCISLPGGCLHAETREYLRVSLGQDDRASCRGSM